MNIVYGVQQVALPKFVLLARRECILDAIFGQLNGDDVPIRPQVFVPEDRGWWSC